MLRDIVKFVLILAAVALVIGGGVAALYGTFAARIAAREVEAKRDAILAVVPEGAEVDLRAPLVGEPFGPEAVYVAKANGTPVAYVASGSAAGYAGPVEVMVGAREEGGRLTVHRVVVLAQQETPGLGANVAATRSNYTLWEKLFGPSEAGKTEQLVNPFLDRFRGKTKAELPTVDGITAATITSNATKQAVAQALERIAAAR